MNPKTTLTVVTVLLVTTAFAGAAVNPAVGAQTGADDADDGPAALQDDGDGEGQDGDGQDGGPGEDDRVTGENSTIQGVNMTNVTLQNVYVNELVANVNQDGEERQVRMENVTVAAVTVRNATVRNATFDTLGMDPELATDVLGQVGDGINPEDDLPSIPIQARNISDRTITGVELGRLEVSNGRVNNVTVEGESGEIEQEVAEPALSGQGVNVTAAEIEGLTVVGLETNETDGGSETTGADG